MSEETEAAWEAVHAALERLPGWEARRPQHYPDERQWTASTFYAGHIRRTDARRAVDSHGETEAEALWELAEALRGDAA